MPVFVGIILATYALDLLSKEYIRRALPLGDGVHYAPFFNLVHYENTGIAFGLFQGRNAVFLVLGIAIVIAIVWMGARLLKTDRIQAWAIALVAGGALGNLTDRFVHGRVTDFLDFHWGVHHWPAFNVADSAICVGAAVMILLGFRKERG